MWPLDLSAGIPVESGVCRPLVSHHSMKLTAHLLPAPRSLLLEAEQLLRERFLFHCRILNIFCLETPTLCHMVIIVSAVQSNASIALPIDECHYITASRSSAGGFPLSYKVSVFALLILTMCIVALLIARW